MATPRAIAFAQNTRTAATYAEFWYRYAKRLTQEWFASNMAADIPNDATMIDDDGKKPLTGADITNIVTRASEIIADYEAGDNAKLNTVLKASQAPWDWQI